MPIAPKSFPVNVSNPAFIPFPHLQSTTNLFNKLRVPFYLLELDVNGIMK